MAGTYDLSYTGNQVEILLGKVTDLEHEMPTKVSDLTNDAGFITAAALPTKMSDLTNDSGFITSAAVPTKVSQLQNDSGFATTTQLGAETTRAEGVEGGLNTRLGSVEGKIPSAATAQNQLADKAFVNSTVATATATFRGTSAPGLTEQQFLNWANGLTHDLNDYVYWNTTDAAGNVVYKRYKWDGTAWVFEYDLNNSSFTSTQWAAINSGITDSLVTKLSALPTNADLQTALNAKYVKPGTGIPKTDLESAAQTSLGKADSAYQKPANGIPASDLAPGVIPTVPTDTVKYSAQTLTTEQKTQARTNIGSASQSEVSQLGQEVNGTEGWADVELTLESAKYYQYNSSTNRIKVASERLNAGTAARISVNPGDKFRIYGYDKSTAESVTRLWCFSDGTIVTVDSVDYYSVLEVAADKVNTRGTGAVITAPQGAAYLTICFQDYDSSQDKLQKWGIVDGGIVGDIEDLEDRVEVLEAQSIPEVIDNLDSDSATDALSAKQGKVIGDELYGEAGYEDVELDLTSNSYYNTAVSPEPYTVKTTPTAWADSGIYCGQIAVQPGEKFKIYGKGNTSGTALFAFADSSNYLLEKASNDVDYRIGGYEFTAPQNAVRLVVNFKEYNSATDKLQKWGKLEQGLTDRVEHLENVVVKSVIEGKNILVFGDSLVEFKGKNDGKTWCQHAAEMSGATFVNVGIGGTRLSSRVPMARIFDASKTYSVGDYVYYLTDGHFHFYECNTQHTGAWDANDFTEVTDAKMYVGLDVVNLVKMACDINTSIETRFADAEAAADCVKTILGDDNTAQVERLKSVDFSTINAIIIMAGTNDYANAFGNSDSDVITEENGAINAIVAQLSTAYGTIPIYFIKEPVKWFPHTVEGVKVYTDDYWCDVYTRNNMTLAEYFDKIEEQFKIVNHIPVCDLYYGLGWNKQNFWNFFGIQLDGTHPYYGFRIVAEKIVSFILANKLF